MGAVFTSAARAPLTSLASVVEMTGDFALTLPVMLAVAIASTVSRTLSYGTIYTTKLLRRGIDIDRAAPWRALADLKIADAMRPFRPPLAVRRAPARQPPADGGTAAQPDRDRAARAGHLPGRPAGPVRHRVARPGPAPAGGLRPRRPAGAVPRRPADTRLGHRASVLRAIARQITQPRPRPPRPSRRRLGPRRPGRAPAAAARPRCPATRSLEITIPPGSPAAGHRLADLTWPPGSTPVDGPARPPAPPARPRPHPCAPATASACSPRHPAAHPNAIRRTKATPSQPATGAATLREGRSQTRLLSVNGLWLPVLKQGQARGRSAGYRGGPGGLVQNHPGQ